jgi:hypothetical protein
MSRAALKAFDLQAMNPVQVSRCQSCGVIRKSIVTAVIITTRPIIDRRGRLIVALRRIVGLLRGVICLLRGGIIWLARYGLSCIVSKHGAQG